MTDGSPHVWVPVPRNDRSPYDRRCARCGYYDSGQEPFGCDLDPWPAAEAGR